MNRTKHAMVQRDGYVVPLIGVPVTSVLEDCDCCGKDFPQSQVEWTGKQMLCEKCRKEKHESH